MSTNEKPTSAPDAPADARQAPTLPPDMLIILPVRNMVLFPGVVMPVCTDCGHSTETRMPRSPY